LVETTPEALRERVAAREWYHTIELVPGVTTPGWFDTRSVPDRLPFPASMQGMRCLDIGTFDGFWAFEMERRGAEEVIGVDILDPLAWDWPYGSGNDVVAALERRKDGGSGFGLVSASIGSRATRHELSIYELDPDRFGQFDFIYLGSLLLHLRDPVGALMRVRSVSRGRLLVVDAVDLGLSLLRPRRPAAYLDGLGRPWWWRPNQAALVRMLHAGGFELAAPPRRLLMPPGPGHPGHSFRRLDGWRALRSRVGRETAFAAHLGDPHCALLARPRSA
jgi:tRNA (mo5U34)-methyltransferase